MAQRTPETRDAAELLRRADFAMYMATGAGKGRFQVFDVAMSAEMLNRSSVDATIAAT